MKTTLLILALCLLPFSSESLKQTDNDDFIKIRHYIGSENGAKQYIEFEAHINAWKGHAKHEEDCFSYIGCSEPPCFGCIHPTEPPVPPT